MDKTTRAKLLQWALFDEFSLYEAAFLLVDQIPEGVRNALVNAIAHELEATVPHREVIHLPGGPNQWIERRFKRADLEAFAEEKGLRPVFLFPDESSPADLSQRERERWQNNIGALLHTWCEMLPAFKYGDRPNCTAIAEKVLAYELNQQKLKVDSETLRKQLAEALAVYNRK